MLHLLFQWILETLYVGSDFVNPFFAGTVNCLHIVIPENSTYRTYRKMNDTDEFTVRIENLKPLHCGDIYIPIHIDSHAVGARGNTLLFTYSRRDKQFGEFAFI